MNYFIYGVPGVGKTYFAKKLSRKLNMKVISGDRLKQQNLKTCLAYKQFGELNETNAVKGLKFVRNKLSSSAQEVIKNMKNIILEAAFLDPQKLKKEGRVILLTASNEKRHKRQFLCHLEKLLDFKGEEFRTARLIQEYLIEEAKKMSIEIIESDRVDQWK